jgi:predicted signal transduction protein with EAL and GGDEF domain
MTVTLHDFGTGYPSLSYLAEMTFDKIKIDRSFVRTLRERPESTKIVDATLGLPYSLGVDTGLPVWPPRARARSATAHRAGR